MSRVKSRPLRQTLFSVTLCPVTSECGVGARIRRAREAAGYSQESLAAAAGATRRTVSRWENDTTLPNESHAARLFELTGYYPQRGHALRALPGEEEDDKAERILRLNEKGFEEIAGALRELVGRLEEMEERQTGRWELVTKRLDEMHEDVARLAQPPSSRAAGQRRRGKS